jgi:uncharacterized membrane-anchored protein
MTIVWCFNNIIIVTWIYLLIVLLAIMMTTDGLIIDIHYSLSKDVVIIDVQITDPFSFLEGQFMMLQTLIGDKIVKRAYSIYSTNQQLQDSQTISFCIKRKE